MRLDDFSIMKYELLVVLLAGLLISCGGNQQELDISLDEPSTFESTQESDIDLDEPSTFEVEQLTENNSVPRDLGNSLSSDFSSITEAAKLSPEQAQQLLALAEAESKARGIEFKVLVPTYIPPGFQLEEFKAELQSYEAGDRAKYTMVYRKSSDSCFYFSGESYGTVGGSPGYHDTLEVYSPTLGKVSLEYTDFDQEYNVSAINFKNQWVIRGDNMYSFSSYPYNGCELSIREAIHITESFQYLNP